jgi:hypothetical protein
MSRPTSQQVRELAQFYATEGDAYGHLAEDLAREAARFEVEEAAFEERVDALAPVVWGELTKHDPNTWPEMSVHSLEGAKDVARVVLVWLDAQAERSSSGPWSTFEDIPVGEYFSPESMPGLVLEKLPEDLYSVVDRPAQYRNTAIVVAENAPFVRVDG